MLISATYFSEENAFRLKTVAKFFTRKYSEHLISAEFYDLLFYRIFSDVSQILDGIIAVAVWVTELGIVRNAFTSVCHHPPQDCSELDEPNSNADLFIYQPPPLNQCRICLRRRMRSPKTIVMRTPRT